MQTQVGNLQVKIMAENKAVEQKAHDLLQEWEKEKPIRVSGRGLSGNSVVVLWCLPC